MAKRDDYEAMAEKLIMPIIESNGYELVDIEYVKEGQNNYLRAYIDKPGGITVDDCEVVSRAFSDKLDEKDFIAESYILEVSSRDLADRSGKTRISNAISVKKLNLSYISRLSIRRIMSDF